MGICKCCLTCAESSMDGVTKVLFCDVEKREVNPFHICGIDAEDGSDDVETSAFKMGIRAEEIVENVALDFQ